MEIDSETTVAAIGQPLRLPPGMTRQVLEDWDGCRHWWRVAAANCIRRGWWKVIGDPAGAYMLRLWLLQPMPIYDRQGQFIGEWESGEALLLHNFRGPDLLLFVALLLVGGAAVLIGSAVFAPVPVAVLGRVCLAIYLALIGGCLAGLVLAWPAQRRTEPAPTPVPVAEESSEIVPFEAWA